MGCWAMAEKRSRSECDSTQSMRWWEWEEGSCRDCGSEREAACRHCT